MKPFVSFGKLMMLDIIRTLSKDVEFEIQRNHDRSGSNHNGDD